MSGKRISIVLCGGLCALFLGALAAFCQETLEGRPIAAINITGNRTSAGEILRRIPLRKGGVWTAAGEAKARHELHEMRIFRSVNIKTHYDEAAGGVVVDIEASDGWYLVPLPFYVSNDSGQGGSLMLVGGNIFRRAETILVYGAVSGSTKVLMTGVMIGDYFFSAIGAREEYTEKLYTNGAYNTNSFFGSAKDDPAKFGNPYDSYTRKTARHVFGVSRKFGDNHRLGLDFQQQKVDYSNPQPSAPSEPGQHNIASLKYKYLSNVDANTGTHASGSFGSIFGLGLSDLEDQLKPLPRVKVSQIYEAQFSNCGRALGSDYDFSELHLGWTGLWELPQRHVAQLKVYGIKGWNNPYSQLIPTGRPIGMQGTYAREWRGDKAVGAMASFAYFVSRSKLGLTAGEPFIENGYVWRGDTLYRQTGVGLNVYYRFWRFPLPIGLNYTYSLVDKDSEVSAMVGFSFGN